MRGCMLLLVGVRGWAAESGGRGFLTRGWLRETDLVMFERGFGAPGLCMPRTKHKKQSASMLISKCCIEKR